MKDEELKLVDLLFLAGIRQRAYGILLYSNISRARVPACRLALLPGPVGLSSCVYYEEIK
jgi:hypothetical protein